MEEAVCIRISWICRTRVRQAYFLSHIRRAHWHSFSTGQRSRTDDARAEQRKVVLYWLPLTAINMATEAESFVRRAA
jgi:hypothetical protein